MDWNYRQELSFLSKQFCDIHEEAKQIEMCFSQRALEYKIANPLFSDTHLLHSVSLGESRNVLDV